MIRVSHLVCEILATAEKRDTQIPTPPAPTTMDGGGNTADSITFLWVHTFPLSVYAPLLLPSILGFVVTTVETIGDVSTTEEVSKLPVEGPEHFEVSCVCFVLQIDTSGEELFLSVGLKDMCRRNHSCVRWWCACSSEH